MYWILLANHNPEFFSVPPGTEKRKKRKSPQADYNGSSDNSNLLHIFNNNIYTDIRTAYKHVFYQILSYKANICGRNSSSPPRHPLFSDPRFQNFGLKVVPLERGGWYCVGFFLIYFTHLKLPILKLILYSHNRIFKLCKSLKTTYTFSHKIKLIFLTPNKTEK